MRLGRLLLALTFEVGEQKRFLQLRGRRSDGRFEAPEESLSPVREK